MRPQVMIAMVAACMVSAVPSIAQANASCSMKNLPSEKQPIREGNRCYRDVLSVVRLETIGGAGGGDRWPVYGVKRRYVKCPKGGGAL